MDSIRDRLASLTRRELAGLAAVVIVALVGVGLWYVRSMPRPVEVHGAPAVGAPAPGASGVVPSPSASPAVLVVNVAGWVHHPGVFEFHQGDRIVDALQAAGGAKKGAALEALNLAALLTDAEQVLVPKKGEGGAVTVPGMPSAGSTSAGVPGAKVNVNTATEPELETLPGVGPVLAQRIIDYRTQHGPFTTVDDLDNVSGIGPATLGDLRDLVSV